MYVWQNFLTRYRGKRNKTLRRASEVFTKFYLFHQCHGVVENRIQDSGHLKRGKHTESYGNTLMNSNKKKRLSNFFTNREDTTDDGAYVGDEM